MELLLEDDINDDIEMNTTTSRATATDTNFTTPTTEIIPNLHEITFTSDNASDIARALRDLGCFNWFGCIGHHFNIIVKAGLNKVPVAQILIN